jgi:hypothetical protein
MRYSALRVSVWCAPNPEKVLSYPAPAPSWRLNKKLPIPDPHDAWISAVEPSVVVHPLLTPAATASATGVTEVKSALTSSTGTWHGGAGGQEPKALWMPM